MGSLMAGWDSPVLDPQVVKYQRNRSYTKGEIDAYWRVNRRAEEQHPPSASSEHGDQDNIHKATGKKLQRSTSLPMADRKGNIANNKRSESILDEFKKTSAWWTRSNWAFLNEPPVIEMELFVKNPSRVDTTEGSGKKRDKQVWK